MELEGFQVSSYITPLLTSLLSRFGKRVSVSACVRLWLAARARVAHTGKGDAVHSAGRSCPFSKLTAVRLFAVCQRCVGERIRAPQDCRDGPHHEQVLPGVSSSLLPFLSFHIVIVHCARVHVFMSAHWLHLQAHALRRYPSHTKGFVWGLRLSCSSIYGVRAPAVVSPYQRFCVEL